MNERTVSRGLFVIAVLVIAPACGNRDVLTDEDLAVYEAVVPALDHIFEVSPPPPPPGADVVVKSAAVRVVMLRPSTLPGPPVEPAADHWRDVTGRALPASVVSGLPLRNFRERNRRRVSLSRFHSRDVRIEWRDGGQPIGAALFSLTLPGYSWAHDVAIVEIGVVTSPMSGGGELVYLRKAGQVWRVVAKQRTWIS